MHACPYCRSRLARVPEVGELVAGVAAVLGLPPPTEAALARLTVRVERSRSGSIGSASVTM
jgi:hypothetical protein